MRTRTDPEWFPAAWITSTFLDFRIQLSRSYRFEIQSLASLVHPFRPVTASLEVLTGPSKERRGSPYGRDEEYYSAGNFG